MLKSSQMKDICIVSYNPICHSCKAISTLVERTPFLLIRKGTINNGSLQYSIIKTKIAWGWYQYLSKIFLDQPILHSRMTAGQEWQHGKGENIAICVHLCMQGESFWTISELWPRVQGSCMDVGKNSEQETTITISHTHGWPPPILVISCYVKNHTNLVA